MLISNINCNTVDWEKFTHSQNFLHSIDFLPEENVHWQQTSEPVKSLPDLVGDVVPGQLPQHVVGHPVDDGLAGVAGLAAHALLGLHAQYCVEDSFRSVDLNKEKKII